MNSRRRASPSAAKDIARHGVRERAGLKGHQPSPTGWENGPMAVAVAGTEAAVVAAAPEEPTGASEAAEGATTARAA